MVNMGSRSDEKVADTAKVCSEPLFRKKFLVIDIVILQFRGREP